MKDNPLLKLRTFGQSIWMDYISRHMITSGELLRLVEEDGVSGVTSNPAIFEQAIARSHDYDDAILSMAIAGKTPEKSTRLSPLKMSKRQQMSSGLPLRNSQGRMAL